MGSLLSIVVTSLATALLRFVGESLIAVKGRIKGDVLETLNDKDLQGLAARAVVEAAKKGMKGDEAYKEAFEELSYALKQRGEIIATNVVDTLLQMAVTAQRNAK